MCGIAGFWQKPGQTEDEMRSVAMSMATAMHHRGPDAQDVWVDAKAGLGLAHARLSIVDLSPAGHQPMVSACERYVIVYNGEVYNASEIRDALQQDMGVFCPAFRGHSDTEVILEACAHWGVEKTIAQLIGMFAFALWDRADKRLILVRDRLGIKPLYWYKTSNGLLFGSELKALRRHGACNVEVDRDAVAGFLRHNCIGAEKSIYQDIHKLLPGTMLTLAVDSDVTLTQYWSLADVADLGASSHFDSDDDAVASLHDLLGDAVQRRMIADVPLGAFLSGGVDSSTVVALMQAHSRKPIKTFSIGFNEAGFDEARYAADVARHLGTSHTELYVTPQEARDVIPKLPTCYDEPFADSSQIPTYLVSAMTRKHVTVALSGDGGDELFGGYNRHIVADRYDNTLFAQPRCLRRLEALVMNGLGPFVWDRIGRMIPEGRRPAQFSDKIHKLADMLKEDRDGFYRSLISHWRDPDALVIDGREPRGLVWDESVRDIVPDFVERMQYLDTLTYLPDDILTKVDRASMAVSLEARVPLLDHRVVELAWRLPKHMKIRNGQGKWILRQVLDKYVPRELIDRPKMGFGVPIDSWLRGPLKEWADYLLSPEVFAKHGLLRRDPVARKWKEHLDGDRNWQYLLWDVLMLHAWAEEYA